MEVNIHLWKNTQHPVIEYKFGPVAGELGPNLLATIAIEWNSNVASLLSTYGPDNTVIPLFSGLTISQTNVGDIYTVTISNLSFPIPGACNDVPTLEGDVWGTQAANGRVVHCFDRTLKLVINDPKVAGVINCGGPAGSRSYDLDITTTNTTPFNVTYKVYLDDGVIVGGERTFTSADALIYTSAVTSVSAGSPIDINGASYPYTSGQTQRSLWVEVSGPTMPNSIFAELVNGCPTPLPVTLSKFRGDLLEKTIGLSWATTEESGSKYFEVQRSLDMREFSSIGTVAAVGTSSTNKFYNFTDGTPLNGSNYYRLKMVDADGSFNLSRTIVVQNEENAFAFQLLGNPVQGGEIRFLLRSESPESVTLFDLTGRAIPFALQRDGSSWIVKPASALSKGLYLLSVRQGANAVTKKVLFL
jgi:hypothetical protein